MMMRNKIVAYLVAGIAAVLALGSCSSGVSYAELLRDERKAVNKYLAYQRVELDIPADTIFETGPDAPYYRLDEDGNVYMQVVRAGSLDNRPASQQKIYFRVKYFDLLDWEHGVEPSYMGNVGDSQIQSSYFIYGNFDLQVSYQWGYGLQMPLQFVGIDSEVNLIIKSQYGFSNEISNVVPYHFNVRYFPSAID